MEIETYVIIDRKSHEILSPVFTTVADCDRWGRQNIVHFYNDFAQITIAEEVGL